MELSKVAGVSQSVSDLTVIQGIQQDSVGLKGHLKVFQGVSECFRDI